MRLIWIILLLAITGVSSAAMPAQAQESPPVLAFYYAWFDQNTWTSGQSVDLPAPRYASADPATIQRHVAQAKGAGIDALVQSWYGPQVENNQTETNFRILLNQAAAQGLQAAVDVETSGPFFGDAGSVSSALSTLMATHMQHPAYLRYQGKPVIFFWRQQRFPIEQWQTIRDQIDPNRSTFWIAEGIDISYQQVFDGHHLYSIAWAGSPAGQLAKWGDRVRSYEADNGVERLWVATAMPGYNDTRLPRANAFAVPRNNGDYFRQTWQGAVASSPDMIIITSFNEWLEGTQLEPSDSYGNLYLDITRELVTGLKGNPPPAPVPAIAAAQEVQEAASLSVEETTEEEAQDAPAVQETPPPDGPYINVTDITNVRSGPSTETDIVDRLPAGAQIPVVGKLESGEWWVIEVAAAPDGIGWVAAEVVEFVGDSATVPVVTPPDAPTPTATPTTDPGASVTMPTGGANVRSGPGLDFELLGRLEEGDSYPASGQDETGDWWQIEYAAGEGGVAWVAAAVVDFSGNGDALPVITVVDPNATPTRTPSPTPTPPVIAGTVEGLDAINVRDEPSTDSTVVGGFYLGDTADVLAISEDGEWWQIDYAETPDQPAWVAAEFVRFTGDKSRVPIFGVGTPTPASGPTNTPPPIATPTPVVIVTGQPTLAPTATSIYQATSAAILAEYGTPEAVATGSSSAQQGSRFGWGDIPWGIFALVIIAGFVGYQFIWRRSKPRRKR